MTGTDEKLLDFTNTDDVSDAAIQWVLKLRNDGITAEHLRSAALGGRGWGMAIIVTARLIQQHRPDLLVDPLDELVREEMAKACENQSLADLWRRKVYDNSTEFKAAKALYQMGVEAGKNQNAS